MKKKKIIFSYDYELFFGIMSGTVQKTLIEPTNLLLDCMESVGARGNFFIDYLMFECLEKLNDERAKLDLKIMKEQVKDMVRRGHRIELHLHPHWIDAKYNGDGTWDYTDYTHYSLYSLHEEVRARMFRDGTGYLTKLAREVDPDYTICAFRAGGWTIQPFGILKKCFKENGIVIDSSVMHGICQDNKYSKFDFHCTPDKETYRFSDDVCIEEVNGEFIEVPITVYNRNIFRKIIEKIIRFFSIKRECITDGTHQRLDLPINSRHKKWLKSIPTAFSMSGRNPLIAELAFRVSNKSLITIIDHPKDFTENALSVIRLYMKKADSITYNDIKQRQ